MAIYTNGAWVNPENKYPVARSSKIKASDTGHIYDLLDTENDVYQGANIKPGSYTGNGLQERIAETPAINDEIAFVCDVPLLYEEYKTSDQFEWKYINKKGKDFKAYEVVPNDVFGVSDYAFTTVADSNDPVKVNNYVVVDGNRGWKELATMPDASATGFIGKILGYEKYQFDTVVLVHVIQNKTVAAAGA
nr:MAG TPA: hypothetical protein [Caudoviricetes sp.]